MLCKRAAALRRKPNGRSTMQHQRAIVVTDETIIDQRERLQLEVNSPTTGKSRLLSAEPSAALTKSCCRVPEAGSREASDNPALPGRLGAMTSPLRMLPSCAPCPYLSHGAGGRARLRGASRSARSRPAARAAVLPAPQCWERGLAGYCCSGDAARVLSLAARRMSRDMRVNWQL